MVKENVKSQNLKKFKRGWELNPENQTEADVHPAANREVQAETQGDPARDRARWGPEERYRIKVRNNWQNLVEKTNRQKERRRCNADRANRPTQPH
jgi:hypothetical protein